MGIKRPESSKFPGDELSKKIVLSCLKKTLNSQKISRDIKMKILFLIFDDYKTVEKTSILGNYAQCDKFNPLGIDDDLLDKPGELLTAEQFEEMKYLVLNEIKKFHRLCTSLRKEVLPVTSELNKLEQTENLYSSLQKQVSGLELQIQLQKQIEDIALLAFMVPANIKKSLTSRAKKLLHKERSLLEELDETIRRGERGITLQKIESILEQKIIKNNEEISKLNFQILES